MKKLLIILLLVASLKAVAQSTTSPQICFGTLTDLRANSGQPNVQVFLNGLSALNDGNGGAYMWDANSTAADNGFTVIKVGNVTTGRWLRLANGNTIKNTVTFSGITLQTSYNVSFGSTLPFIPAMIIVQPYSANAAALSWISNISTTGFTINFITVPVLGTNNITFSYCVIKQ